MFVFPSLFEGFGLPVIEAMACGTPVICSNVTALPEVAGDAAILFDPIAPPAVETLHATSLQTALERVLDDGALRAKLREKGLARAAQFSWQDTAARTFGLYRRIANAGTGWDLLKILHIYKDYWPILGGIENHVKLLAEGQAARGHAVTALVTNSANNARGFPAGLKSTVSQENDVRVVRAGRLATVASTPLSLALPWRLLREQPDVVHLHFPYPVGEIAQWLLRRGRATVMTYHSDVVRQASILASTARSWSESSARSMRSSLAAHPCAIARIWPNTQPRLHLIPYGIPLSRFEPHRTVSPSAGPGSDAAFTLLFVGRLRYYKGLDTLIRALPQIPARLLVVGIGPMEAEWKALARELGVAERDLVAR